MNEPETIVRDFRAWLAANVASGCVKEEESLDALLREYISSVGVQDIDQYVGDLRNLQEGIVYQKLTEELTVFGVKPKHKSKPSHTSDILERYRAVPLHAIFLYTSEDQTIASYLTDNWGALDTLSGDRCDIHPTVDQFKDAEDAYDFIDRLDVVRQANFKEYSQLPGLFFWDLSGNWEYVSFSTDSRPDSLKYSVRLVFEEIGKNPSISSVTTAKVRLGYNSLGRVSSRSQEGRILDPIDREVVHHNVSSNVQVFVSHSSKDADWCSQLVDALKQEGLDVWYDQKRLYAGARWIKVIEEEIQKRKVFLIVLTPDSWASRWVRKELELAMQQERHIIGVIQRSTNVSGFLKTYHLIKAIDQEPAQVLQEIMGAFDQTANLE